MMENPRGKTESGSGAAPEIWTIQKLLQWTTGHFAAKNIPSARLDAELLLAEVLGCARLDLYLKFDQPMKDAELKKFRELVVRRSRNEPVAYILGRQEFYGRAFQVTSGVLIPRPETEGLIDEALQWIEGREDLDGADSEPKLSVLDVGAGSGCLSVTIAAEIPWAKVLALDVSEDAVKMTAANALRLEVKDRVTIQQIDFLKYKAPNSNEPFDLIVSNPPYVGRTSEETLQKEVKLFEPAIALYGGERGHEMMEQWIPAMGLLLKPEGLLLCEIGFDQGPWAREMALKHFKSVEILKDYSGHDRIIKASGPHG